MLKKVNLLFLFIFAFYAQAGEFALKTGDVLLIELNCYSCQVIADETESRFSHSAVVLGRDSGEVIVAQALGKVHATTLTQFKKYKKPGISILVRRPYDFNASEALVASTFIADWMDRPFDSGYTWDDEKLYCSEFVTKFLEVFLGPVFPPKPLDFSRNWQYWSSVLNPVPQGEPGNSPGDLETSDVLYTVGEIF